MSNIYLLFVCFFIGLGLQRIKLLPRDAHVVLNTIILYVALPALIILTIPSLEWDVSLLTLTLVPWITFAGAYFLFPYLGRKFHWEKGVVGCLILTAGLGNTSFVGFPVIEGIYGKSALKYAILLDQPGTFLICLTLGIWLATVYSHGKMPKRALIEKVVLFPPFVAFVLAMILTAFEWQAAGEIKLVLERLSNLLTPLALFTVGLQLKLGEIRNEGKYLLAGLGYQLFICPLVILLLYWPLGLPRLQLHVAVMEAAMAPMITASIIAATHNLQPRLAGMMVGVGVPLSFLTLTFWYFLLQFT